MTAKDEDIVWSMLQLAAHEPSLESVRSQPQLLKYARSWGCREGDFGVVAEEDRRPVGAAWARLYSGDEKGLGHVDDDIPELAVAVVPGHQGKGVGSSLMRALISEARQLDYRALSLSCRTDNPALRLYQRLGFEAVAGSKVTNRVGGTSETYVLLLDEWS